MLTVVEYGGILYYVIGASFNNANERYLTGLRVDNGNFGMLYFYDCNFQYFVDDKGHKLDLNFKRIKDKE